MDIAEMHVAFRQYAQQMGMQNVRAILPEQIDIVINQSIMDTVNQLIRENIGITNDRVVSDNSKIGQINAFRTLYKVNEKTFSFGSAAADNFVYNTIDRLTGLVKHTAGAGVDNLFGNYMFLVDISIKYESKTPKGTTPETYDTISTAWYPVRIIDDAYLSDTLNDFVLKNRWRSPIAVVYDKNTIELYIDKIDSTAENNAPTITVGGSKSVTLTPKSLRISTIQYPAKVKFVEDISEGSSVDCDLPESMHGDIVKHAVDLYRVAVNGSLHSSQEAEQAQQRENVRNNYRNEGS